MHRFGGAHRLFVQVDIDLDEQHVGEFLCILHEDGLDLLARPAPCSRKVHDNKLLACLGDYVVKLRPGHADVFERTCATANSQLGHSYKRAS